MEPSRPKAARPPQPRQAAAARQQDSSSSSDEEDTPRRSTDSSSSAESASSGASSSASDAMPPPPLTRLSTPPGSVLQSAGAGASTLGSQDDELATRPSRSESTASRTNRLSLTLPIAPPTSFPSRPTPASSTAASFPGTPNDLLASGLASPAEPVDLITAIAAQERRVLELREELSRAESGLTKLKKQWATHEAHKKRAEIRKTEPLRSLSSRPSAASAATATAASIPLAAAVDDGASRRNERDRRKSLLLGQQPGSQPASQPGSGPNTPTQSRRRVFKGGHARTLSLLSPTKSAPDGFEVHEDQTADGTEDGPLKSPLSPLELDSPFLQNLGRYAPAAATQLSKRASWAPQSVHQAAGNGFKQVAGDLTATLWTFVEDLRQATVGEELVGGANGMIRTVEPNARTMDDSTIRASASGRPHLPRAFTTTDVQGTPTPPPRPAATATATTAASSASSTSQPHAASSNSRPKTSKASSKTANGKEPKRFSWAPLSVDSLDDNDWSSWESPAVKSPRWSGSTANGEAAIPEQADENTTPQNRNAASASFLPSSPSGSRANDINWPAALNRLTPGSIKRTATDLMKEWEKSLSPPADHASEREGRIL